VNLIHLAHLASAQVNKEKQLPAACAKPPLDGKKIMGSTK